MLARSFLWRLKNDLVARNLSASSFRREILDISKLPDRIIPRFKPSKTSDLLSLQWPSPPRNFLMVKKGRSETNTESLIEYAKHIHDNYSSTALIFEPSVAEYVESSFKFPIYTFSATATSSLASKVDLTTTLGGDGTILRASSLFATTSYVPPILSFSMGTLGFLGEWKFSQYKRAFRELYMSGAAAGSPLVEGDQHPHLQPTTGESHEQSSETSQTQSLSGWSSIRGKSMGPTRSSKILLRNRLRVSVWDSSGNQVNGSTVTETGEKKGGDTHAMNEVLIHRGANPHLSIIEVYIGGRFLTEAVADGMIVSTPTGSTAYSLSSGGSIVHPLVNSLLITPICPRSLSFRPLVLPANTPVTLRLSTKNRGRELELSVDGKAATRGVGVGMEVRVSGEECQTDEGGSCLGGVPCVIQGSKGGIGEGEDDGWVGGLNGLLKFNYPFGEEESSRSR